MVYGSPTQDIIGYTFIPAVPCTRLAVAAVSARLLRWGKSGSRTSRYYGPEYTPRYDTNVDKSGGALLPSVTIAVKPFEWLQPFVKYSKSYRPPTIMELFLNGGHDGKASMNMRRIRLSGPNEAKPMSWAQTSRATES